MGSPAATEEGGEARGGGRVERKGECEGVGLCGSLADSVTL